MSVRFHRWRLGFKQCSFRLIARALQDKTLSVFEPFPLLQHALFPYGFRFQVNRMAQRYPSEPLLTVSRIQYRVPRRTVSAHPALTVQPPDAAVANGQKAPNHGFALSKRFLPVVVDLSVKPDGVTPSLQPHYRAFHTVGSEEAHLRAGLRPPLKLDVQFSCIQLSPRCAFGAD
jgi:hypothetical protein